MSESPEAPGIAEPEVDEEAPAKRGHAAAPIPDKAYFRIGEVARLLGVKPYVLRYWETEFRVIRPQKSRSQQRLYRRRDVELLRDIRRLLYEERYTIEGARKRLRARLEEADRDEPEAEASRGSGRGKIGRASCRERV